MRGWFGAAILAAALIPAPAWADAMNSNDHHPQHVIPHHPAPPLQRHVRVPFPFGYYGDWGYYQNPGVVYVEPSADADYAPAPPVRVAAEQPPCNETSAGVAVVRGMGCSRGAH